MTRFRFAFGRTLPARLRSAWQAFCRRPESLPDPDPRPRPELSSEAACLMAEAVRLSIGSACLLAELVKACRSQGLTGDDIRRALSESQAAGEFSIETAASGRIYLDLMGVSESWGTLTADEALDAVRPDPAGQCCGDLA